MRVGSRGRWVRLILAQLGCLLAIAAGVAVAAEPPEYELLSSFGPDGTESSGFSSLVGSAAADQQSSAVYVLDGGTGAAGTGALFRFDNEGKALNFGGSAPYISGNKISNLSLLNTGEHQVAVDSSSHEVYITSANAIRAFQANGEPALFAAGPGSGTNEIGGFTKLTGLAVDENGNIYASDKDAGTVTVFSSLGAQVTQFSTATPENLAPANLAVNTDGVVYVNRFTSGGAPRTILKFIPSSFPVTGATTYAAAAQPLSSTNSITVSVDPTTNFVYASESKLNAEKGRFDRQVSVYDESDAFLTSFAGPEEEGEIKFSGGIAPSGAKSRVFVTNQASAGSGMLSQVRIFEVKGKEPPEIEAVSAAGVTADSVSFHAQINPHGLETTYYFEYGLEDCSVSLCTKVPAAGGTIPAGTDGVSVSQPLFGLQAATIYHYRVVAENELGVTEGADRTFTTQGPATDFALIDKRAWEMVSPTNKRGGQLTAGMQASEDGNGVSFLSVGSIEADPEGNRALERSAVLARRSASDWQAIDVAASNHRVIEWGASSDTEYRVFSPDLSKALLEPNDGTQLSPQASERTPYLRENTEPPVYTPLVTGKEGFANVPLGTEFGGSPLEAFGAVRIIGTNPDLSHVALSSSVPLSAGAPAGALYHWAGGQLQPLSVLPSNEGGTMVPANMVGSGKGTSRGAVAEDGSRIFWSHGGYGAAGNSLTALYVREMAAGETGRLDIVQSGASGAGSAAPVFQGANPEGTVAFFTDTQQLTEDASPKGQDLYRCEISLGSVASGCASLVNLTSATANPGESGEVLGLAAGMSEDATSLYFVAKGVLDSTPNEFGDEAVGGKPNLYRWEEGEGVLFIATLSEEDSQSWGFKGSLVAEASTLSANASPSGRYLAFMSQQSLTGEDNRDPGNGELVEQVFRYDAAEDRLDCVSCNPTGAAPEGEIAPNRGRLMVDPVSQWEDRWVAAILPPPLLVEQGGTVLYRSRSVLDNGRVFFNAFDGLVPADSNGEWDVYQFEPTGVGSCSGSAADSATAVVPEGCISLISSGDATEEAGFLDASTSGDDAFFFTPARLSVTDKDKQLDVYDARVNGTPAAFTPVSECTGGACRSTGQPPSYSTPASETFKGRDIAKGKTCPKGKKKAKRGGKVRCVPRKQGKKKSSKKRAGQSGRASR